MSPGAVEYLLRGSGCAEHEHAGEASAAAVAAGPRTRSATCSPARRRSRPGCGAARACRCSACRPVTAATEAQVRAVFGRLEHPTRVDLKTGEPVPLGSRPRNFSSRDERVAQALAAEPDATEERRRRSGRRPTREAQAGGLLRPDVLPGQVGERVLGGRCWRPGATPRPPTSSRHTGPGSRRRWPTSRSRPPTCGRAITARPRPGSRSGSTSRPAGWCGSAGTTRPAARSNPSCTAT